jgi:hypothetical protein
MALAFETITDPLATSVDVSQNAGFCYKGHDDFLPVLVPRGKVMLLAEELPEVRPLSGLESLYVHGFPRSFLDLPKVEELFERHGFSDHFFKDLAGNSFQGFMFAAILLVVLLHFPEAPEDDVVADASDDDDGCVDVVGGILDL